MQYEAVCLAIIILVPCLLFIAVEMYRDVIERRLGETRNKGVLPEDFRFWIE